MALATTYKVGGSLPEGTPVTTVSGRMMFGTGVVIVSCLASAQSASELLRPLSVTSSNIARLMFTGHVTRFMLRGRYNADATTAGHAGIVRVYAYFLNGTGKTESDVLPDDGTVRIMRLDATSGTGYTLSADPSTDFRDTTYRYTKPMEIGGSTLIDACGASGLIVLLETAATLSGGSSPAVAVEVGVL